MAGNFCRSETVARIGVLFALPVGWRWGMMWGNHCCCASCCSRGHANQEPEIARHGLGPFCAFQMSISSRSRSAWAISALRSRVVLHGISTGSPSAAAVTRS